MSNRIDSMQNVAIDKTGQKVSKSGGEAAVKSHDSADSGQSVGKTPLTDSVEFTDRVQLLGKLEKAIADLPAIDRARVEAVKADIANGNYEIDIDNIVDIIMRTERDFGS